jgi:hypothetical protein
LIKDRFKRYNKYFPYADADDKPEGWDDYVAEAEKDKKVDGSPLSDSYKDFLKLKMSLGKLVLSDEHKWMLNLRKSPYFKEYYFVGLVHHQGFPAKEEIKKKATDKDNKGNEVIQEAWNILKDVK